MFSGGRASVLMDAFWGYLKSLSPVNEETIRESIAAPRPVAVFPKKNKHHEMRLTTSWTKHLRDAKEIEDFRNMVLGSQVVLGRLADILEQKMQAQQVFREEDYKDASWANRCADRNGYHRGLREILTILKGVDHDTSN